jgi:uncharacterized protein YvpB
MPYLKFKVGDGSMKEFSGNNLEDFQKAFEKDGTVVAKKEALKVVELFFTKRNLKVMKQKLERGEPIGVKKTAEELDDEMDDASDDEEEAKEAYNQIITGKKKGYVRSIFVFDLYETC